MQNSKVSAIDGINGRDKFYKVTFRKKIYETIEQLQNELDQWIDHYNNACLSG